MCGEAEKERESRGEKENEHPFTHCRGMLRPLRVKMQRTRTHKIEAWSQIRNHITCTRSATTSITGKRAPLRQGLVYTSPFDVSLPLLLLPSPDMCRCPLKYFRLLLQSLQVDKPHAAIPCLLLPTPSHSMTRSVPFSFSLSLMHTQTHLRDQILIVSTRRVQPEDGSITRGPRPVDG